ncbi:MAG: EFR1 family ferrodoxin [Chloroflexota bacterium]
MPRTTIAYFSGTGNTWQVARFYAEGLAARGHEVALLPLERQDEAALARLADYDLVGLGYPIHAWNAPRLVAERLARWPSLAGQRAGEGRPAFVFVTARSTVGGALDWARTRLSRCGYQVVHQAPYFMGAYYLEGAANHPSPEQAARRLEWTRHEVHEAVVAIAEGRERRAYASDAARLILSGAAWRLYLLGCRQAWHVLRADARCTGCGACVAACPTGNIALDGAPAAGGPATRVRFGGACTLCLRCLGVCPVQAIQLPPVTRTSRRYLAPGYAQTLSAPQVAGALGPEPTHGADAPS